MEISSVKQIEEMANDIAKICPDLVTNCCGQINCVTHLTLSLSKIGYRKASDVAKDIFAEIEAEIEAALKSNYKALDMIYYDAELYQRVQGKIDALRGIEGFIEELRNKYMEDEK